MTQGGTATGGAFTRRDIGLVGGVIGILALLVMPLPAFALDILLAASLSMAILTFLLSIYVERPLDFSSFPTLLLFVTLYRLALNVASTRLILMHGHEGTAAAGTVIRAFGKFAVGGNYIVGAVVFMILVIVNFIVITKGAERIAEVGARFTLDSMPGKQMAVDADLGAGVINEKEARRRRKDIARESDFYGSMDGASKFVRGDAVASLIIVAINVVGGMIIGIAQNHMPAAEAASTYTILSIGDGLVGQIPALLISTGSALLATRTADESMGDSLGPQLLARQAPLGIAAAVLAVVGMLPNMPHLAFFVMAGVTGFLAVRAPKLAARAAQRAEAKLEALPSTTKDPIGGAERQKAEIENLLPVDLLALEVGLDLLSMVDADRGGELLGRIASLRKQLATDLGLIVPPVHVRDDLRMRPGAYRILISGVEVGKGQVKPQMMLAIDPSGKATSGIGGEVVTEPTFGLPAKWITVDDQNRAEAAGCTVVDASAVVATHLTELIRRHAGDMIGRREAQELIEVVARDHQKLVEDLIPNLVSLGDVIKVLRNLLEENVSIRDMRTILETIADNASDKTTPLELTECVRQRLSRRITRDNTTESGELHAMVFDPAAEELFRDNGRAKDPRALSKLTHDLEMATRRLVEHDEPPLLVVAPDVRQAVASVASRHVPGLTVMSYREVDPSVPFVTRSVIVAEERAA